MVATDFRRPADLTQIVEVGESPSCLSIAAPRQRSYASSKETPMRYMCLVHFEPARFTEATLAERQEIDRRSLGYDDELRRSGHYIASEAIQAGDSAVLVRVRDGKLTTTDGPFIETKEQMAGFILIEARDMNEAVRLAAGIPLAEIGTIEVRPVFDIPTPP
jgi:hypothetical protein